MYCSFCHINHRHSLIKLTISFLFANLADQYADHAADQYASEDADFAAETAQMTKAQILQQAGISILSQANASSQSVLSLLG